MALKSLGILAEAQGDRLGYRRVRTRLGPEYETLCMNRKTSRSTGSTCALDPIKILKRLCQGKLSDAVPRTAREM